MQERSGEVLSNVPGLISSVPGWLVAESSRR